MVSLTGYSSYPRNDSSYPRNDLSIIFGIRRTTSCVSNAFFYPGTSIGPAFCVGGAADKKKANKLDYSMNIEQMLEQEARREKRKRMEEDE